MGANLVAVIRNFSIHTQDSTNDDDSSTLDGCIGGGTHRILRFDFLSHNAGQARQQRSLFNVRSRRRKTPSSFLHVF